MKKQLIAIGVLGLAASSTFAFVLLNPARKWFTSDLPVTFRVNANGEESVNNADHGVTAVRNAIAAWNAEVPSNIVATTTTTSNAVGNDGQNVISFNDPARIVRNAIAVTLVGSGGTKATEALLDTGSDDRVFPDQHAAILGVDLANAPQRVLTGISPGGYSVRYALVRLRLTDGIEFREWPAWVGFTNAPLPHPTLGYAGCLQFFTATFRGDAQEVELTVNSAYTGT